MVDINFEIFLDKDISEVSFMGYAKNDLDQDIYIISEPQVQFFGKPIDQILITTHENKKIKYIYIIFFESIDTSFYKIMSDEYGENYDVMIFDKVLSEESTEITEGSYKEVLKKKIISLRKGSIKDQNINSFIWDKKKSRIMLYFNYLKNRNEIHFVSK